MTAPGCSGAGHLCTVAAFLAPVAPLMLPLLKDIEAGMGNMGNFTPLGKGCTSSTARWGLNLGAHALLALCPIALTTWLLPLYVYCW